MTYQAVAGFSSLVHEVYAHAYMYVTVVEDGCDFITLYYYFALDWESHAIVGINFFAISGLFESTDYDNRAASRTARTSTLH